jgi:hypothetical protein
MRSNAVRGDVKAGSAWSLRHISNTRASCCGGAPREVRHWPVAGQSGVRIEAAEEGMQAMVAGVMEAGLRPSPLAGSAGDGQHIRNMMGIKRDGDNYRKRHQAGMD